MLGFRDDALSPNNFAARRRGQRRDGLVVVRTFRRGQASFAETSQRAKVDFRGRHVGLNTLMSQIIDDAGYQSPGDRWELKQGGLDLFGTYLHSGNVDRR